MLQQPSLLLLVIAGAVLPLDVRALEGQAPALNTPPALPLDSAGYGPTGLRVGLLLQFRGDFPEGGTERTSTFFLRKAELGLRARVAPGTDILFELDPVRPSDPFRRTYVRLSHIPLLHLKLGLEKAPIGLEELLSSARIPFVDRSAVSDRFAAAEEVGVHLDSRWDSWLVQFSVTNGGRRLLRDDNDHKDVTARVVWAPASWISLGLATLRGRVGAEGEERNRSNAEFKVGSVDSGFQAELYRSQDAAVRSSAFYLAGFHAFASERPWLSHLQPAIRYERIDRNDQAGEDEVDLLTFGIGILLDGHRSKIQSNYLWDLRPGFGENEIRVQYQAEF